MQAQRELCVMRKGKFVWGVGRTSTLIPQNYHYVGRRAPLM